MAVEFNHTIVAARDAASSAAWLATILGCPAPRRLAHFHVVSLDNGVSLDHIDYDGEILNVHLAFLVSEDDFDAVFGRITERGMDFWADPRQQRLGEIGTDHGRGCYFLSPDGHYLEILTRSYPTVA